MSSSPYLTSQQAAQVKRQQARAPAARQYPAHSLLPHSPTSIHPPANRPMGSSSMNSTATKTGMGRKPRPAQERKRAGKLTLRGAGAGSTLGRQGGCEGGRGQRVSSQWAAGVPVSHTAPFERSSHPPNGTVR